MQFGILIFLEAQKINFWDTLVVNMTNIVYCRFLCQLLFCMKVLPLWQCIIFFEIMLPQPQASLPHSYHLERPPYVTENFINSTDAHSTPFFISIVLFQVSLSMLLFFLTSVLFLWKFFRMYFLVQLEHFDSLLVYWLS